MSDDTPLVRKKGGTKKVKGSEEAAPLDHTRLRILSAIEKHTGRKLEKANPNAGIADAEAKFHVLVGELAKRKDFHQHHDVAAGALIAAGRHIKSARAAVDQPPTRLQRFHALVGIQSPTERHLGAAGDLLHAAHAFTVLGDKALHEHFGQPLTHFAQQPVPKREGFHAATFAAGYRGELTPRPGLAKHLVDAHRQFSLKDTTGAIQRLRPKAVRPPSDAPKGLDHDPVVARQLDPDAPKTMLPPVKKTGDPKRLLP